MARTSTHVLRRIAVRTYIALHLLRIAFWYNVYGIAYVSRELSRCSALVVLSSLIVVGVSMNSESMGFGLRWTPSGQLFTTVLNRLSDVDRDGYGLLRNPRDAAPFDAAIHPYAVDIPGNGIDEDGLAGDLPPGAAYTTPPIPA
ncbi:MAG: hypothetical protein ABI612_16355, partial [Betaproteobacteria bacterium]